MLEPNLVNALDMAAANGILDYDGAAYLTGTTPRYMGSPEFPLSNPSMHAPNLQQPKKDEMVFKDQKPQVSSNPLWKKVLFGALCIGVGLVGLNHLRNLPTVKKWFGEAAAKTTEKIKNVKKPDTSKWPSVKECYTKVCDFFKDNWNKVFKKKQTPTT